MTQTLDNTVLNFYHDFHQATLQFLQRSAPTGRGSWIRMTARLSCPVEVRLTSQDHKRRGKLRGEKYRVDKAKKNKQKNNYKSINGK